MTVKMPEPMTAPMPRAVSDQGPSVFFSAFSGSSDSRISLSMDLQASSWLGSAVLLVGRGGISQRKRSDSRGKIRNSYGEVYMMQSGWKAVERDAHRPRRIADRGDVEMRVRAESEPGSCLAAAPRTAEGLALGLTASQFLDLLLVRAAGFGALGLGRCLLAGGALDCFTFDLVFDLFCICH